uniref:SCP domain-containing protein n=1 Tax=Strongyloides papillosus TaxID=174720 RepID=A0A0N5BHQ4_STREA
MVIFYCNHYITFFILSILFFQYHTLENNVEKEDSALFKLIQNDLSSKNTINHDSLIHSVSENNENKYIRKRQTNGKEGQKKQKSATKAKSKTKLQDKKSPRPHPQPPRPVTSKRPTTNSPSGKRQKKKPSKGITTTRKTASRTTQTKKNPKKQTTTGKITPKTTQTKKNITKQATTIKSSPTPPSKSEPSSITTTNASCGSECQSTPKIVPPKINETSSQKPISTPTIETSSTSASTSEFTPTSQSTTTSAIENSSTSASTSESMSTSQSTTTPYPDKYAEQKANLIKDINEAREAFQAQKLIFDPELANTAQKLANESAEGEQDVRNTNDTLGLLTYYSDIEDSEFGLSQWIAGSYTFNFDKPEENPDWCDDFSQLVWASSERIGCGISKSVDNIMVVACLFSPKGNIKGKYRENVHKKKDWIKY